MWIQNGTDSAMVESVRPQDHLSHTSCVSDIKNIYRHQNVCNVSRLPGFNNSRTSITTTIIYYPTTTPDNNNNNSKNNNIVAIY